MLKLSLVLPNWTFLHGERKAQEAVRNSSFWQLIKITLMDKIVLKLINLHFQKEVFTNKNKPCFHCMKLLTLFTKPFFKNLINTGDPIMYIFEIAGDGDGASPPIYIKM